MPGWRGEAQHYILYRYFLYRYFEFAVVAFGSAVCLLVTILVGFRGLNPRLALMLDGVLVLASPIFSCGIWIARW